MRPYVEAVSGWNEEDQLAFHQRGFDPARIRIIAVDGHDAGSLIVEHRPIEIYLERIEIHPEYQGCGIGSQLIQQILLVAADRGQPVELDVLHVNSRAHALYQRLGFHDVTRHGTDGIKIRMRATPQPTNEQT